MSRETRRRRARVRAAALALLALVGGAGVVVFGGAQPASAAPVVINSPLPGTNIDQEDWLFQGDATPFDNVRVSAPGGEVCTTTADFIGEWSCNVEFPESGPGIAVTAISIPHTGPGAPSDTRLYDVAIPPTIEENGDSVYISQESLNPVLYGTASPGAQVTGAVNGTPCADIADGNGDYACEATGAGLAPNAVYMANTFTVQQPVGVAFNSQQTNTWYVTDNTVAIPDVTLPYDTTGPGDNVDTSDRTPVVSGAPGTAEDRATVFVYGYQFSSNSVAPNWLGPPPPDPGAFTYCVAQATSNGAWSCSGSALPVDAVWVFGVAQEDVAGNGPLSPDSEFSVRILPPPPAPTLLEPVVGYQSLSDDTVHISTTNLAVGTMQVREGATNLCAPTVLVATTFQCDTIPLSDGYHTIRVRQSDQYGTFSAWATRLIHIGPYPKVLLSLDFTFRIIGPDGTEVGPDGLQSGDAVTIEASGLPPGAVITAEIHSTPIGLGSAAIGPDGVLALATTIPEIEAGDHDIVVSAEAPGYSPRTVSSPVMVYAGKQLGEPEIPEEEPLPEKQAGDEGHPAFGPGGPGSSAHGFTDPSVFGSSVDSPFDDHSFALSAAGIVLSGSIAIAFILLVGFPAELLESTIRSNYDRAFGWMARIRSRVSRIVAPVAKLLSHPWVGTGLTIFAAAFLLGFADPDYGFNGQSVRLLLAMILAVVAINIGLSLIVMRVAKRAFDVSALLKPMPGALAIVAISVLVSRLAGISPGFLFGIVLGVAYARELKLRDDARLGLLGVGLTIAAGLLAWVGYGIASATISGEGFANNLLIEVLAAITLEALGTLVVALLPIEFMDGRTIFRWSKLAWLGAYAVTALVFLFVVVPLSDNWGTMSAPMFGWGTLFAVFAIVAIATWAIFRRRPRVSSSSPAGAGPQRRQRR